MFLPDQILLLVAVQEWWHVGELILDILLIVNLFKLGSCHNGSVFIYCHCPEHKPPSAIVTRISATIDVAIFGTNA